MSAYADLTTEEQGHIQTAVNLLRGATSSLMGIKKGMSHKAEWIIATVDPLIAGLDDAEVIPNTSGLGGASDVTVAEYKLIRDTLRTVIVDSDVAAKKAAIIKLIGVNA